MSRDWRVYLEDVRDYAARVLRFTDGMTFEQFVGDERTYHAVLRSLEVVGEAVKHLPEEARGRAPEIPWRRIAGFRDRLAHVYFDVDPHIVWDAARNRIPSLHEAVVRILAEEETA